MPNQPNRVADDKYPASCPVCAKLDGYPAQVSTDGLYGVNIVMTCHGCGHEWNVHRNVIPIFGRHKLETGNAERE